VILAISCLPGTINQGKLDKPYPWNRMQCSASALKSSADAYRLSRLGDGLGYATACPYSASAASAGARAG